MGSALLASRLHERGCSTTLICLVGDEIYKLQLILTLAVESIHMPRKMQIQISCFHKLATSIVDRYSANASEMCNQMNDIVR